MTKVNLETQVEGTLPASNVEGLNDLISTVNGLASDVNGMEETVGSLSGWQTGLNTFATGLGYSSFSDMIQILTNQIEMNRFISGASPVTGYNIPPP